MAGYGISASTTDTGSAQSSLYQYFGGISASPLGGSSSSMLVPLVLGAVLLFLLMRKT